jgi:hypothetical protein
MGMSSAFSFAHRRRALVLGSATILLHWTALGWLNGQLGRVPPPRQAEAVTAFAELVPAPPLPLAPARLLPLHTEPLPPPPPVPPLQPFDTADPARTAVAQAAPSDAQGDATAEAGQGGAAPAAPGVRSLAQTSPAPAAAAPAAPAAPSAPPARSYRADLPPSADLTLDVERVDADGTRWSGEATLGWKLAGGSYRARVEVGIRLLFAHVNLLVLTSEGASGEAGFVPAQMTEKRRGRALTATHFNRDAGTITFSASQNTYPLASGAQDKATVPLQLAAIARADPGQLSGNIDIQVGEDRDASVFRFVVLGQEDLDTRLGRLHAWHLSRPPKPGSYSSRLDVWLAPGRGWYPVKIRNTEASGAVTTQTVNNIQMTDTGS